MKWNRKKRCCLIFSADQRLTSQVHEIVGRINGRFGTLTTVPIYHLVSIKIWFWLPYTHLRMGTYPGFQMMKNLQQVQWIWTCRFLITTLYGCKNDAACTILVLYAVLDIFWLSKYRTSFLMNSDMWHWQDRSLDFHRLCALYAVTGFHSHDIICFVFMFPSYLPKQEK